MLVTLSEAHQHLRLIVFNGESPDDPWLNIWIPIVESAVQAWLKDEWRMYALERDSNGEIVRDSEGNPIPQYDSNGPILNPIVRGAILVELGAQFRFREADGAPQAPSHWGHGYTLGVGATALLNSLRKSTVA